MHKVNGRRGHCRFPPGLEDDVEDVIDVPLEDSPSLLAELWLAVQRLRNARVAAAVDPSRLTSDDRRRLSVVRAAIGTLRAALMDDPGQIPLKRLLRRSHSVSQADRALLDLEADVVLRQSASSFRVVTGNRPPDDAFRAFCVEVGFAMSQAGAKVPISASGQFAAVIRVLLRHAGLPCPKDLKRSVSRAADELPAVRSRRKKRELQRALERRGGEHDPRRLLK